ncbi:MAG: NERD domain-containing protein [Cryobacterium sp.]|nr:NERD domain-containing protein [Cryobacterium sp.]
MSDSGGDDIKTMRLRYAGTCACGAPVPAGTQAGWNTSTRSVICPDCLASTDDMAVESGTAGASLRREHERRVTKRESRIRAKHPHIGGLILAVTDEPASTRAFATGAVGEEKIAASLENRAGSTVLFLHNRKLGLFNRGDIDHIAVAPSGVYVIDAKHYDEKKVEVRRSGGWLSESREQLIIGGRDRTPLLQSVAKQVTAVRQALDALPGTDAVQVKPVLCFLGAYLPWLTTQRIGGVPLLGPKDTAAALRAHGQLDEASRRRIRAHLASLLPPA